MTAPEAPLTPAEADLTGYAFMPLFGEQLFGSDFNLEASDAEFRAAVRIWWAAWTQVPAASLPNDEKKLCQLAGLGREGMTKWKKMRPVVMRNFVLCSDGRLYHRVLAPHAIAAWEERKAAIKRGKASGVARRLKRGIPPPEQREQLESVSIPSRKEIETETNKGEGERENPNTAFPVVTTSSQEEPPAKSGPESNPKPDDRRKPGLLNLLVKHRVAGWQEHPLIVDRVLASARDEHIVQAFNEAARSKGGQPYDIGFFATIVERISTTAREAFERERKSVDRAVENTQAYIAEHKAVEVAPMPDSARAFLPRFG